MKSRPTILEQVQVASPCPAAWANMAGDERVRFCTKCQKHVYNLSAMNADEAAELVTQREGRLCVRFFRRADGTMLTQDCPVGLANLRRRVCRAILVSIATVLSVVIHSIAALGLDHWVRREREVVRYMNWTNASPDLKPAQDAGDVIVGYLGEEPAPPPWAEFYVPTIELENVTEVTGVVMVVNGVDKHRSH